MSCDFAHNDGSYVLGALAPAERQAFEQHLAGCTRCARSVRELAGLPGLLARVDPDVLESPPITDPVPDTLLLALVHQVRRTQRRRRLVSAGVAAAAAVVIATGSIAVTGALNGDGTPTSSPSSGASRTAPSAQALVPVGRVPVRASMTFESVAWGTRLELTCTYLSDDEGSGWHPAATYALFVRSRDGRTEQVATWRALPDRTMRLAAATAASLQDIASVEVRTADGKPVLELTV